MMMFETSKHDPKTEKRSFVFKDNNCCNIVLSRPFGKVLKNRPILIY